MRGSKAVLFSIALLGTAVACSHSHGRLSNHGFPSNVRYVPEPRTGPFVVVAVDNHFHDIHPVDETRIASHRRFVVENQGSNLHNFTVEGTGISVDIRSGDQLVWKHIGQKLHPGTYLVFCKYHVALGMRGKFIVTP